MLFGWSSMPSSDQGSRNNADSRLGKPAFRGCLLNKPCAGMGLWSQTQLTPNYLNSVGADLQAVFEPPLSVAISSLAGLLLMEGLE